MNNLNKSAWGQKWTKDEQIQLVKIASKYTNPQGRRVFWSIIGKHDLPSGRTIQGCKEHWRILSQSCLFEDGSWNIQPRKYAEVFEEPTAPKKIYKAKVIHQQPIEYLKPGEVANIFRVSPVSVRNMIHRGDLKAVRLPGPRGGYRISRSEIEKLLA